MKIHDEEGQALLLALGFLMFFGLVIGAMLSFASASMLGTQQLRVQRYTAYAADGALDDAIQVGRLDPTVGAFGAMPCMHSSAFTTTVTTPDPNVTVTVTVTCNANQGAFTDRDVTFTAMVGLSKVAVAEVHYYDSIDSTGTPTVEVLNWTYCGHDAGLCPP